mgnify:FL=1
MKIFKNILLGIILLMVIVILVIIGLEPVVIELYLPENPLEDDTKKIIDLGVVPKTNSRSVRIVNNNIYINDGGTYEVSGILYNGTIYIDTSEDVTLNFNEVTIVNENTSVIDNRKSKKVIINLKSDTNNILSDGSTSASAIKSVGDLFLQGGGNLLIYGNNENGITVSNGSLIIDDIILYIIAQGDAFNVVNEFLINSGTVLGFANDEMQPPSDLSKQNTLLFNFGSVFKENTAFSLVNSQNESLINFIGLRDFKTLTLSIPKLDMGRYRLLKEISCDARIKNGVYKECEASGGEIVNIGITDSYVVNAKWNWYGPMDIIINYVEEIEI